MNPCVNNTQGFFMASKNFIITSHTEGENSVVKKALLHGLVKSIKLHWPNSYVIISSQSEVEYETQCIADYIITNRSFQNIPYGSGEVDSIKSALALLKSQGKHSCYKIGYDFVINESNCFILDEWANHKKEFVSCWWNSARSGIGSWLWFSTVSFMEQLLSFPVLDSFLEEKFLSMVHYNQWFDRCYLYDSANEMLANTWDTCGDLVLNGGNVLKRDYGSVLAVIPSTDRTTSVLPLVYHAVVNQKLKPAHLQIIERTEFVDLRNDPVYQKLFNLCEQNGINWSVVFSPNVEQAILPGFTWCWCLDENVIPAYNELETLYRATILDHTIESIEVPNGSKLFKLSN